MIIGKNTNLQRKNSFINQQPSDNSLNTQNKINPLMEENRVMQHTNVMSQKEMKDKAFSMLQDRLDKGLISLDEFNRQCSKLGKIK